MQLPVLNRSFLDDMAVTAADTYGVVCVYECIYIQDECRISSTQLLTTIEIYNCVTAHIIRK